MEVTVPPERMEPVFPFTLDLAEVRSGGLTRTLHRQLRAAILERRLPAGFALPSTRRLAEVLGVGRNTVVAAYDLLVAEGHARARAGARPRVVGPASTTVRAAARRVEAAALDREHDGRIAPAWRVAPPRIAHPRPLPARSFRTGVPEDRGFDHDTWRRLTARALRTMARQPFHYGAPEGLAELREAIAGHVAFVRAVVCEAGDLVITSGAQQAFDLLARLLVTPGRTQVAFENPGYMPARAAFAAAGARLVPVPVDAEGMRVDRLPDGVKVICVTPSHQMPTGAVMSAPRRQALLDRARELGAVIVEDDYDGEFQFEHRAQDALQTLDRQGRVFYVGTFSKSLFPSLRTGFVVAPPWAREALIDIRRTSDSHGGTATQATLAAFITEGHLARHIRRMRPIYQQRRRALVNGIEAALDGWFEVLPGAAGLHLSVRARAPAGLSVLVNVVQQHMPGVLPLSDYAMGKPVVPGLCMGYGCVEVEQISKAVRAAARALGRPMP
jgi:GntR family transcriptional regulator / MocR family aminotransferase